MQDDPSQPLTITAPFVAKLFSISERHVWSLHATGRLPRPIRLGRSVRWNLSDLIAWRDAGCPSRDAWEQMKAAGRGAKR